MRLTDLQQISKLPIKEKEKEYSLIGYIISYFRPFMIPID
jgi:hypothetical protein